MIRSGRMQSKAKQNTHDTVDRVYNIFFSPKITTKAGPSTVHRKTKIIYRSPNGATRGGEPIDGNFFDLTIPF